MNFALRDLLSPLWGNVAPQTLEGLGDPLEMNRRLMTAIEAVPDGFCLYDRDDRLVLFNRRYLEVYPKHAQFLRIGERFEDMLRAGVERGEFAEAAGREEEWIAERVRRHQNPAGPIEQRLSDGRWLRIVEKKTSTGEIVGVRSDITALKQACERHRRSEEKLRDFADAAGDWFWEMDAELRFTYMSRNVERIVGVPREWHYGRTREELLGEDANLEIWQEHLRTLRERRPFRDFEYLRVGPDIEPKWLRTSGKPIFDYDGRFAGYRGCATDITEQKLAEERLRASEAQLAHAQKMEAIGQLTGGIAHDFNNLMQVILGNAEFLAADPQCDQETVRAIIEATKRGAELTQRLLAYARKQMLVPQSVDLTDLVQGVAGLLGRLLGATIEIVIDIPDDLPLAYADPNQIETALLNLALNARDAMPKGGRLWIRCCEVSAGDGELSTTGDLAAGNYVLLAVSDEGVGMSEATRERAVEPFFTTKRPGEGAGLGLSTVYGFAKQSGGHLNIDSKLGHGTTVELYLPTSPSTLARSAPPRDGQVPEGQAERILLVEDDPHIRALVRRILQQLNYRVVEAENAMEAMALLEAGRAIDLLLSDVVLPKGRSGPELAAEVRSLYPEMKVVFMSGYPSDSPFAAPAFAEQVLLTKPFHKPVLARALRQALDGTRPEIAQAAPDQEAEAIG